ncbi:hypothetical protein CFOL_v3_16773 [Cephalotus follicularis]|uniref:Retrovirus-related Pol polyprotein from transposon TNT 1-94-like beta-barrel domain-containing protein n=1 Tax=Cephalotus follicularis TaxID=3775 RepID=A0A1Q3BZA2_CEPFO|nr:hypothetical protein CFOL_v3_16773 [Cephalotus follicularis]
MFGFCCSLHICKDKDCFITLNIDGDFGYITVCNKERVKIEGVGSVRFKLHTDDIKTLRRVNYEPKCSANIILWRDLASRGYSYRGQGDWCKVYKQDKLILQGKKN